MLVLFTSHRVEMLKHFEEIAKDYDTIVIEEPKDSLFERMLKGDITIDYYVENLNTSFPLYSTYQCEVLRRLYSMGKKIYQVEPYLEMLERFHRAIESKQPLPSDELAMKVRVVEKKVGEAWIDYQEAFMRRDFDALVDSAVRFTKADAERFIVRDEMRAEEIAKIGDCLVEAGQIHILLPEILKEKGFNVDVVDLPREVANKLGIEFYLNPGNELTIKYMLGEDVSDDEAKLMCAQSIIYVSLIPKDELLPSDEDPYPHLKRECRIAKKVRKLSYDECKELFHRIWGQKLFNSEV
ncbi:hypothetical protein [Archaeoglobus profundus]|uniref:Uncharacterized protein n=1 Tax=Archaeoglobus profundus (strain DSM 5631 / JCM 9629 / NBRC 100127 / Av18) TaxID=572546 RepID=D2RE13_ARCPA|nr:hypothetical protein [Archaeoglobus profundus]ADB58357.1 conserved hypothetical protein [Archaeoglobus profundus DSM 5631]